MRRNQLLAVGLLFALLLIAGTDLGFAQRGGRGGGGGGQPTLLDDAAILEDFDDIVELIWTDQEEDAWKDADTDEQKQAFITAFWEGRDPTPGTEDNEFREQWMARAAYANRAFNEGSAGYGTDRGKFYLIYGPEVMVAQERKQVSGTGQGSVSGETQGAGRGTNIIWTIDKTQNPFLEGKKEVTFAQYNRSFSKLTGGIEYSQEAFLAGQAITAYFEARRANPAVYGPAAAGPAPVAGAGGAPPAALTPDVLAMQRLMQSGTTMQDLGLRQKVDFIPAQGGNAFALVNFEIDKAGLTFDAGSARVMAFGVVLKKDPAATNGEEFLRDVKMYFDVAEDAGNAEQTDVHSFGMTLSPGDYRLAWGVMDDASERIATTSLEFETPDYAGGELAVPSVIVASRLEEQTDAIDVNTVYQGTRVGNIVLSTDLDGVFGRNDELLVLYFIKGLAPDPATQQVSFEVDHRILLAETGEGVARMPTQPLAFSGVQQPIPLAQVEQLEAGTDYQIEIHIKDLINGNELTHLVPFSTRGG